MNVRLGSRAYIIALGALVVGLFLILSMLAPSTFPTLRNATSMASQLAPLGILALCIALTFLLGGIDLSIVAVANGSAIAAALTMAALEPSMGGMGTLLGVLAGLAVGVTAGTINGTLVAYLRVHPIPITLGTLTLFTGIATGITDGSTVYGTGTMQWLGNGTFLYLPISFWLFLLMTLVLAFVTTRTRFGFQIYALGASEKVSRFGRLHVERTQVLTYLLSGVLASVAGVLMLASTNAANVSFGSSFLIQAILVAVLSGVNPYGGRGRIILVLLAVIVMQQVQTGINLALGRWSGATFAAEFSWGVLLIAVLAMARYLGASDSKRVGVRWRKAQAKREDAGGKDDCSGDTR